MNELEHLPFTQVLGKYSEQKEVIHSYIDFLKSKDYIFECNNPQSFPPLSLEWDFPAIISNAVLFVSDNYDIYEVINKLSKINVYTVKLKFSEIDVFYNFDFTDSSLDRIKSIVVEFISEDILNSKIIASISSHPKIVKIILNVDNYDISKLNNKFKFRREESLKKKKSLSSFLARFELLSESQKHHTYFNRKLFIMGNGDIKNALDIDENFSKIQNVSSSEDLKQIVSTLKFQKYWYVNKDSCDVCKDCEFRHVCIDSRLPIERNYGSWYHNEECNYNPYICKWEGENGYKTLKECGVMVDKNGYQRDDEKIEAVNEVLWS